MSRHRPHSLSSLECVSDSNTSNSERSGSSYEDLIAESATASDCHSNNSPEAHWLQAAGLGDFVDDNGSGSDFIRSLGLNKRQYNTIRKRIDDLHARVSRQLQQSKLPYSNPSSLTKAKQNQSQPRALSSTRPDCRSIFDTGGKPRSASVTRTEFLVQVRRLLN